jgi:uncharacterized membrane protein
MSTLVHDTTGLIHLIASLASLVLGTLVLVSQKGTSHHKRMGYAYVTSMVALNVSAFGLYHLFGRFGPFHVAAIISSVTLLAGIIPAIIQKPAGWVRIHITFMYYSVIGLYAAFASEIITRVIHSNFGLMVGLATAITMGVGIYFFRLKYKIWLQQLNQK